MKLVYLRQVANQALLVILFRAGAVAGSQPLRYAPLSSAPCPHFLVVSIEISGKVTTKPSFLGEKEVYYINYCVNCHHNDQKP